MSVLTKKTSVSLRDIAQEAGVSLKTASRVLNGESAAKHTAEKVLAAAKRLNYRPNLAAGAVFGRQTRTVGLMIPSPVDHSFYGKIVRSAHDELVRQNYAPILVLATPELDLKEQIHRLVDRRVDGIILRPMYEHVDDVFAAEILERDIPLVTVLRPTELGGRVDHVDTDAHGIGAQAARHLMERGHRRVGCLSLKSPLVPFEETGYGITCLGFRKALQDAGAEAPLHCRDRGSCTPLEMAEELLDAHPDITAVFTPMDSLGLGIYAAAQKRGLSIPDDLSVIGSGNLDHVAHMLPPMSTFDNHPERIGMLAARRLIERIEKKVQPGATIAVEASLIERDSVAAPRDTGRDA